MSYYDYYQPEAYVPASDTYIAKDAAVNAHIEQMRLSATKALLERRDTIVVATVSAIYGLGDPRAYLSMVMHLDRGDRINQRAILRRLAELQYVRNDTDLKRATYRVRGEIIDIYPADSADEAVRIALCDDEISQLSYIDPLTTRLVRTVSRLTIYPKTHYVTPPEQIQQAIAEIKQELATQLTSLRHDNKLVEAERLAQRTQYDIELLQELGYCQGIENYSRYLSHRASGEPPPTLLDYLPPDALLVIDESHVTLPQLHGMYRGDRSRKETLVCYGFRLPSALDNRPLTFAEFSARAPQTIYVSATPGPYEYDTASAVVEQLVRPTGLLDPLIEVRRAVHQVDDLLSEINRCVAANERVLVTTLTKRLAEYLSEYLADHQVKVRYLHSNIDTVERVAIVRQLRLGIIDVIVGINLLREGLDIPEASLVAILDADKEGFLRSETALIQTIGRVARHYHGKAILYAERITASMQRAIDETTRRREQQDAYNKAHHITPKGIEKAVHDIMEEAYSHGSVRERLFPKVAQPDTLAPRSVEVLSARIATLEKKMYQHAHRLEFEQAAQLRDTIQQLREALLVS